MKSPTLLLALLAGAAAAIVIGALLLRRADRSRSRAWAAAGWLVLLPGIAVTGLLALAQLTGRMGYQLLWFHSPTFYLSAAILAATSTWWVRRPTTRFVRFGIPALAVLGLAALLGLARSDGRSAPLSMLVPTLGHSAPPLVFYDGQGRRRELAEFRGKVVLVNFWASWCGPCRQEMPMLSKQQSRHAGNGFVVLYISLEDPDVVDAFYREHRYDGIQGRLAAAAPYYDAGRFYPLSYLIDREGRVAHRWSGRPSESWLENAIREQLG
jgi:cytochrome c biogenesis protein CcmG, thiol:disulfide interchange protein DsbE